MPPDYHSLVNPKLIHERCNLRKVQAAMLNAHNLQGAQMMFEIQCDFFCSAMKVIAIQVSMHDLFQFSPFR